MAKSGVFDLSESGPWVGALTWLCGCMCERRLRACIASSLFTCESAPFLLFISVAPSLFTCPRTNASRFPSLAGHDHTCVSSMWDSLLCVFSSPRLSWILFAHVIGFGWAHAFEPQPPGMDGVHVCTFTWYFPIPSPSHNPALWGNNLSLASASVPPHGIQGLSVPVSHVSAEEGASMHSSQVGPRTLCQGVMWGR